MTRDAAPPPVRLAARTSVGLDIGCALLLLIGIVRLFALVLHDPLLGYANQYDMARTSACVDVWPSLPGPKRFAAHQSAPLPDYVEYRAEDAHCYRSSAVAFVVAAKAIVVAAHAAGFAAAGRFPLRAVGIVQALALLALVLAFCVAERARPWARLAHAAVFAVVLADPANTLWLNTLYTESATLFFAYAVAGLVALRTVTRPGLAIAIAMIVALAGLASSRQQYAPFAVLPLLILAPYWWRNARLAWVGAALALVAAWALLSSSLATMPAIRAANNHDFYLGAALPAVRDEPQALARLGLPAECRAAIGANWYVGMGADPHDECTEVASLGRVDFLRLLPGDPALPWRILVRGVPETQVWWQHYLGMIAGESFGDLSMRSTWLGLSLASATERVPLAVHFLALGAVAAGLIGTLIAWGRALRRGGRDDGWLRCVIVGASLALYAPVSAIFGDGYVEVARHALLLHSAMAALALLCAGRVILRPPNVQMRAAQARSTLMIAVLAAAFGSALWTGARHWPLARGVVDGPATRGLDGTTYAIRGWALDPFGVASIGVAAYDDWDSLAPAATWKATIGLRKTGPQGESLERYFPTYPESANGGFAVDIPRAELPAYAHCLRTRVQNRLGVVTEIDRRCVQP